MVDTRTAIWYDFVNAKYGGQYLVFYLKREHRIKKWVKILTILFSAGGIFTAFKNLKIPTIISLFLIGAVQIISLLENQIFHATGDVDKICKMRIMYLELENDLEILFNSFNDSNEESARARLFELRKMSTKIEEIDNSLNITFYKKLDKKTDKEIRKYLTTYYGNI